MKRVFSLLLVLALTLSLAACGDSSAKWQEQYDLGQKYLTEGSYEEAILAFTAAIEIDPKQALAYIGRGNAYLGRGSDEASLTAAFKDFEAALDLDDADAGAYLGLAEVYIARDQFDEAMDILRRGVEKTGDQRLSDRLAELESGNVSDYWGQVRKETHYDGDGTLTCWYEYDYNDQGQCIGITSYGPDGSQIQRFEPRYDVQGREVYELYYLSDDGEMEGATLTYDSAGQTEKVVVDTGESIVLTRDTEGRLIRRDRYDPDGILFTYEIWKYGSGYERRESYAADGTLSSYSIDYENEQGQPTRVEWYEADGTLVEYHTWEYDADGNMTARNFYDGNGNLTGRDVYN